MRWSDIEGNHTLKKKIPEYNLLYLKEMVLCLPNFDEHKIEVSDSNLKQILEHWIDY